MEASEFKLACVAASNCAPEVSVAATVAQSGAPASTIPDARNASRMVMPVSAVCVNTGNCVGASCACLAYNTELALAAAAQSVCPLIDWPILHAQTKTRLNGTQVNF